MAQQITKAQMQALIDRHCSSMPQRLKAGVLHGCVLIIDGESYQAPIVNSERPIHHIQGRVQKAGNQWTEH
jgi:hypothetical protein